MQPAVPAGAHAGSAASGRRGTRPRRAEERRGGHAKAGAASRLSGRAFLWSQASNHALRGGAGAGRGVALVVVYAASSAQAGAETGAASTETGDAGPVRQWDAGSVWDD